MFQSARIKLTAWYLLIIMVISLSFSLFIYQLLSVEIVRFARAQRTRFDRGVGVEIILPPRIDNDLIIETKKRLLTNLIVVNSTILTISAFLGYFLAGRTLDPIKKMIDEQNKFISDSSHELRTPLTSLKSSLEVNLRDKKLSLAEARQLISESINEVNKLQLLSDELLMMAQYQKPNSHQIIEKVSLDEVITESLKKVNGLAIKKNIEIVNKIKNISLQGNKYSLIDLFVILLDNAIKYSSDNKKVFLSAKVNQHRLNVLVKDQGIGIDRKDIPFVFDRFYRADSSRTKNEIGGYGLGLSIAQKIANQHSAKILIDSQVNRGSTFTVSFQI